MSKTERSWFTKVAENAQQQLAAIKRDQEVTQLILTCLAESRGDPEKAKWYLEGELRKKPNIRLELTHESSVQVMANPRIGPKLCEAAKKRHPKMMDGTDAETRQRVSQMLSSVFSFGNNLYHRED